MTSRTWADGLSGGTPITAASLNGIEADITANTAAAAAAQTNAIADATTKYGGLPARVTSLESIERLPWKNNSVVNPMFAGHGWTNGPTTNATFNLNDTTDHILGDRCVTVTTDGTGASGYIEKTGMNLDLSQAGLVFWVKATNMQSISSVAIKVGNADTYSPSWFGSLPLTYGMKSPVTEGEWFPVYFSLGGVGANTGTPTRTPVTAVRITLTDKNGLPAPVLKLGGFGTFVDRSNKYPSGVVSFTFDDTYAAHSDAAAKLGQYSFPATEYLIQSRVDTTGYLTTPQLRAMNDAYGWEIGSHASNDAAHIDWTTQTTAWVDTELAAQKSWRDTNHFPTNSFAYPIGPFNSDITRRASNYYDSARSTYPWTNSATKPHRYRLSCYVIDSTVTLATAKVWVDRAVSNGGWLTLLFHNLVASAPSGNDWLKTDFDSLVDYVAASGLPVATVPDVINNAG